MSICILFVRCFIALICLPSVPHTETRHSLYGFLFCAYAQKRHSARCTSHTLCVTHTHYYLLIDVKLLLWLTELVICLDFRTKHLVGKAMQCKRTSHSVSKDRKRLCVTHTYFAQRNWNVNFHSFSVWVNFTNDFFQTEFICCICTVSIAIRIWGTSLR